MAASGNYITSEGMVDNWDDAVSTTETFATSAVAISTDRITVTNDIVTGSLIRFSSTGVLPDPLVTGTAYYAIKVDAAHIEVATTPVAAAAGTAVDLTDVGSGTHTLDVGEGSSAADRQKVINRAEQLIENITDDFFYAKAFTVYRDGNGNDRLFVGLIPDIISVTAVLISGITLISDWYTNDVDSIYLDPEAVTGSSDDLPELHLRLKYKVKLFPKGMGNIKITGTYGWSSVPAAIEKAAIILCRAENDSTLYSSHEVGLKSEKLGDYSYTMADAAVSKSTGIDAVDKLLKHYIRHKPMLGAI